MRKSYATWVACTFSMFVGAGILAAEAACAQSVPESEYAEMQWRMIGPFRAGKVNAVAGIPGNPAVYYFGANGGGVWKTIDGGTVWKPIFDKEPVAPIGALALAPLNPNIIYVGTGVNTITLDVACCSLRWATPPDRMKNAASSDRRTAGGHGRKSSTRTTSRPQWICVSSREIPAWCTRLCGMGFENLDREEHSLVLAADCTSPPTRELRGRRSKGTDFPREIGDGPELRWLQACAGGECI